MVIDKREVPGKPPVKKALAPEKPAPQKPSTSKSSSTKKVTSKELSDIQKGLAELDKLAKAAEKGVAPSAEQAQAATEMAKNAIQGLAAATGSGLPSGFRGPSGSLESVIAASNAPVTQPGGAKDEGKVDKVYTAPDGTTFTDQLAFATYVADLRQQKFDEANKLGERKSAFSLLKEEFDRYGIGDLVGDVEQLARQGLSAAEYSLELRKKPAYTQRFAANQQRINSGLRALSEAEYISLEDQYQQVMRQYGLPQSFYSTGKMGRQPELEKFIAGDVSPVELEDRVQIAVDRVKNAAPEVIDALTTYYGGPGGITQSNLVAYVLDPQRALPEIKRKVAAAEIGAAGKVAGFGVTGTRAEELAMRGVTQAQAQQGYQTAAEIVPRAEQLASIYGAEKYDQTAAEQEIFGLAGAASARRKRQKLSAMEQAQFGARTGMAGSALERGRSGAF